MLNIPYLEVPSSSKFSPFEAAPLPPHPPQPSRVLTLEEVEAEQAAAAQMARMSLSGAPQENHRAPAGIPAGDQPQGYSPSPLLAQAIPTSGDLEILRLAQQQHQQQQARHLFAQQHQQRQQELFDQQYRPQRAPPPTDTQRPPPQPSQASYSPQFHQQLQQPPPPRFAQHRQQHPAQQNEFLARMQIMDSLIGPPLGNDHVSQVEPSVHSLPPEQREALMNQAMNKIIEAERMEERRRRRMLKIAKMVRIPL